MVLGQWEVPLGSGAGFCGKRHWWLGGSREWVTSSTLWIQKTVLWEFLEAFPIFSLVFVIGALGNVLGELCRERALGLRVSLENMESSPRGGRA